MEATMTIEAYSNMSIKELAKETVRLQRAMREMNQVLQEKDQVLQEKDQVLQEKELAIKQRDEEPRKLREQLEERFSLAEPIAVDSHSGF